VEVLSKPFISDALMRKVRQILDGSQARPSSARSH
jgi:hypothetical protein